MGHQGFGCFKLTLKKFQDHLANLIKKCRRHRSKQVLICLCLVSRVTCFKKKLSCKQIVMCVLLGSELWSYFTRYPSTIQPSLPGWVATGRVSLSMDGEILRRRTFSSGCERACVYGWVQHSNALSLPAMKPNRAKTTSHLPMFGFLYMKSWKLSLHTWAIDFFCFTHYFVLHYKIASLVQLLVFNSREQMCDLIKKKGKLKTWILFSKGKET